MGRFGDEKRSMKIIGTQEAIAKAECLMMNRDTVSLSRKEAGVMLKNGGKTVNGSENESETYFHFGIWNKCSLLQGGRRRWWGETYL